MRKCIIVTITDDLTVEEVEESFIVTLERGPTTNSIITVERVPAVVTIRDDDGMGLCVCGGHILSIVLVNTHKTK